MSYRSLKPAAVKGMLEGQERWIYVDVRTVEEFERGHVPNAFNVPVAERDPSGRMKPNPDFAVVIEKTFPRDAHLVLGCASGGRSQHACELLEAEGYTNLVNMQCGFLGARGESGGIVEPGWQGCGYPVEDAAAPERTYRNLLGNE